MSDPERPHSIPSSPISVCSDDPLLCALVSGTDAALVSGTDDSALPDDSAPIFADNAANAESVPAALMLPMTVDAANDSSCLGTDASIFEDDSADLLVCGTDAAGDAAGILGGCKKADHPDDYRKLQEHVAGPSTWTSIVLGALSPKQKKELAVAHFNSIWG